jgi:hypothetical protein
MTLIPRRIGVYQKTPRLSYARKINWCDFVRYKRVIQPSPQNIDPPADVVLSTAQSEGLISI